MATARKVIRRLKIKKHIRRTLTGTAERPRLSVFRSNNAIYAQIIDDVTKVTLVAASSIKVDKSLNKVDQAKLVGQELAKKALEKGLKLVAFDRSGYLYHGRIKSLAEGAREGGLDF